MPVKLTSMKVVERINTVVVRNPLQVQESKGKKIRRNPYVIEMNRGRNCYSCRSFGYLARNCKNRGRIRQKRRIEYRDNMNTINNLKEKKNLVVLN